MGGFLLFPFSRWCLVRVKVLCRFEKITALEVVTGNVKVRSLPTISVGQVHRGLVEEVHSPNGANSSAWSTTICSVLMTVVRSSERAAASV